ncbi:hypothetical protein OPV22_017045 [Ensete ventricosum]|uniref:Uncharacterized protein n=1 Tax=Ensete ventricosum TaxID=4639 RepID=A0AAV8QYT8_ENSVE|nr:hypothetical protein OPV22_017045 [Ensete ventricosum]
MEINSRPHIGFRIGNPLAHLPQTHTLATESDSLAPAAGAGVDPGKVVAHEPGAAKTGRSPWRKTASTVDSEKPDDPVIDAESWPTLGDARTRGSPDCADKVAPAAVPPPMAMGNAGPAPWNVPPPPPPPLVQGSMGMRKSGGFGSNNSSKHHSVHSNKHGPRRNTPVNDVPHTIS